MKRLAFLWGLPICFFCLLGVLLALFLRTSPHGAGQGREKAEEKASSSLRSESPVKQRAILEMASSTRHFESASYAQRSERLPDTPEKQAVLAEEIRTHQAMKQALSHRDLAALNDVIAILEQNRLPSLRYELALLKVAADCLRGIDAQTQVAAQEAMQKWHASTVRKWVRRICEIP